MADSEKPEDANEEESEERSLPSAELKSTGSGFFSIYKSGQGYYTRMITAGAIVLLLALLCHWFSTVLLAQFDPLYFKTRPPVLLDWAYTQPEVKQAPKADDKQPAKAVEKQPENVVEKKRFDMKGPVKVGIVVVFFVAIALLIWRYLNKPHVVDFLIETEKEMAKVNWTARRELIGSTKVVIIFMFLIAGLLFLYDIEFGQSFFYARVLGEPPISWGVDVDALTGREYVAVKVKHPQTGKVLVEAHEQIGDKLEIVKAAASDSKEPNPPGRQEKVVPLEKVVVAPSLQMWLGGHLVLVVLIGIPMLLPRFRKRSLA